MTTSNRTGLDLPENTELLRAWQQLIVPVAPRQGSAAAIGQALLDSWGHPGRRYHDITHLRDVLDHIDELADYAEDSAAVRLAAWYHDAVYLGQPDDEENSARRAEAELADLGLAPSLIAEVVRLVRLTSTHDPLTGDRNGETLCDADLAILATPPDRYATYVAAIRDEYTHVPDDMFRAGRANVLQALLDNPTVFRTPRAHQQWEASARLNLRQELDLLTG
jgi:predicted metal-dependent HD superfamily phosphohydrolase